MSHFNISCLVLVSKRGKNRIIFFSFTLKHLKKASWVQNFLISAFSVPSSLFISIFANLLKMILESGFL